MPLPEKVRFCALVAEVRIDASRLQRNPNLPVDELVCTCTILQGFKVGVSSNSLTLTFNYLEPRLTYEGKTFLVFAFEHEHGYRPYGGQAGLVEKGHAYNELVAAKEAGGAYSYRKLRYDDLVQRVKAITTANQQGKANGSESFGSNTNRTLTAAGSRCSR